MTASPMAVSPSSPVGKARRSLAMGAASVAMAFPVIAWWSPLSRRVHASYGTWLFILPAALLLFVAGTCLIRKREPVTAARGWAVLCLALSCGGAVLAAGSTTYPFAVLVVAAPCGACARALAEINLGWRDRGLPVSPWWSLSFGVVLVFMSHVSAGLAGLTAAVLAGAAVWLAPRAPAARHARVGAGVRLGGPLVMSAAAVVFIGATNPRLSWLGPVTSHGPSNSRQVALTFDDGPNSVATDAVLQELAERNVRATFFLVGKAVDREPAMAARILAAGHLIGDHSYNHDGWRYLQPGYPELGKGEDAILRAANVCPRYYRPPHGTHTPFVWLAARRHEMRLVNWSVSAADWSESDPDRLATRIVEQARGGSIILLHDGIDGLPNVDRAVLVQALPKIIDGLRARGLEPVRLDTLLGSEGMRPDCRN